MPYVRVVEPADVVFPPDAPKPPNDWPISKCTFERFIIEGYSDGEFAYGRYAALMDYQLYSEMYAALSEYPALQRMFADEVRYFIDYSIWPAPTWWGGGGYKPGWYYVSEYVPPGSLGYYMRVTPPVGSDQLARTEEFLVPADWDYEEGPPNYNVNLYPAWYGGPWL